MAESYNICLDVGGTKVLGAIFNEKDEIIFRLKKRSKGDGDTSSDVEKVIISVVEEMITQSGINRNKLKAIASCAPGVIDQERGVVLFAPNLPWRDYDMASSMRKKFGVPFFVGNDVNLGVYGEYHYGEQLLDAKDDEDIDRMGEADREATDHDDLGDLVRHGVQGLAQVADHVEAAGDIAVQNIRDPRQNQDGRRALAVALRHIGVHEPGDEQQPDEGQQVGDGEQFSAEDRLHSRILLLKSMA